MKRRRGKHGFDSPYVLAGLAIAAVLALAIALMLFASVRWLAELSFAAAVVFALSTLSFLWTMRTGKFIVWNELLDSLALRGDEHLLDAGCGRGAVLMLAAKHLPMGHAIGVDLWSTRDQSGNSEQVTLRNAEVEGVRDRVESRTADMRRLPFPDQSFDVITSSLAIHNLRDVQGREATLAEILRVLKTDGIVMIADLWHGAEYQRYFSTQPGTQVERRGLGWRFWYGGPHAATMLVTVRRQTRRSIA